MRCHHNCWSIFYAKEQETWSHNFWVVFIAKQKETFWGWNKFDNQLDKCLMRRPNKQLKLEIGVSCHCNCCIVLDAEQQQILCVSCCCNCWVVLTARWQETWVMNCCHNYWDVFHVKQQKTCWGCINVSHHATGWMQITWGQWRIQCGDRSNIWNVHNQAAGQSVIKSLMPNRCFCDTIQNGVAIIICLLSTRWCSHWDGKLLKCAGLLCGTGRCFAGLSFGSCKKLEVVIEGPMYVIELSCLASLGVFEKLVLQKWTHCNLWNERKGSTHKTQWVKSLFSDSFLPKTYYLS